MARMGNDSSRAALIYQHATPRADRMIADALNTAVKAELKKIRQAAKKAVRKTATKPGRRAPDDPDEGTAGPGVHRLMAR